MLDRRVTTPLRWKQHSDFTPIDRMSVASERRPSATRETDDDLRRIESRHQTAVSLRSGPTCASLGINMSTGNSAATPAGSYLSSATAIIAVVDKDASVRESLNSLICDAGGRSHICASANEFLARPRVLVPSCLTLDIDLSTPSH